MLARSPGRFYWGGFVVEVVVVVVVFVVVAKSWRERRRGRRRSGRGRGGWLRGLLVGLGAGSFGFLAVLLLALLLLFIFFLVLLLGGTAVDPAKEGGFRLLRELDRLEVDLGEKVDHGLVLTVELVSELKVEEGKRELHHLHIGHAALDQRINALLLLDRYC